jgi:cytochrome P450 / NADPH-cytochrome P450 reductase
VTLTYSILDEPSLSNTEKRKLGVTTSYLSSLEAGDKLHVAVRQSQAAFHLPADAQNTPVVMVAAGTGVAPFRGFLQERAAMAAAGRKLAPALLFFGCRNPGLDDLYREQFDTWQAAGVVDIRRAFSRVADDEGDEAKGCRYVQDRLWLDREEVSQLWDKGARVYVCGSRAVGNAVNEMVIKIHKSVAEERGETLTQEEAEAWLVNMRNVRFAADVFD